MVALCRAGAVAKIDAVQAIYRKHSSKMSDPYYEFRAIICIERPHSTAFLVSIWTVFRDLRNYGHKPTAPWPSWQF